jgi:hypothetical protein
VARPDALERREILYGRPKKTPNFQAMGKGYQDAGILSDACEAYERIGDEGQRRAALEGVKVEAVAAGDWFILRRLDGTIGVSEMEWRSGLDAATKAGKLRYALRIAEQLADEAKVVELRKTLGFAVPEPEGEGEGEGEGEATATDGDAPAEGEDAAEG